MWYGICVHKDICYYTQAFSVDYKRATVQWPRFSVYMFSPQNTKGGERVITFARKAVDFLYVIVRVISKGHSGTPTLVVNVVWNANQSHTTHDIALHSQSEITSHTRVGQLTLQTVDPMN